VNKIRVIAIGVITNPDRSSLLVFEGVDRVTGQRYCRPLGGGVEFGELGRATLKREMREELSAEITNECYLGTLENLFSVNGERGHEIVLIYRADLLDAALYSQKYMEAVEDDGSRHPVIWATLKDIRAGQIRLVPGGLLEFLDEHHVFA
jgi:8-oxo-dGTP pyrophosphatase MutT (NUDIX family)